MLAYCTLTSKPYLFFAFAKESFYWFVSYRCGLFRSIGNDCYIIKLIAGDLNTVPTLFLSLRILLLSVDVSEALQFVNTQIFLQPLNY